MEKSMVEEAAEYTVAVGLDGSNASLKAVEEAIFQAKNRRAILHLVSIQETTDASYSAHEVLEATKMERQQLESLQRQAKTNAEAAGVQVITTISKGQFASAVIEYLKKQKIDLLVLGDVGHSSIWGALLGTNVDKIVRNAPCSVLVVR